MFNAVKFNALHRGSMSLFGVAVFAVVVVLLPVSARAQCRNWDASGEWEIRQGAGSRSTVIRLNLKQSGFAFSGTVSRGSANGKVTGDADRDFHFEIDWLDGRGFTNFYKGQISDSGELTGETYVGSDKHDRNTWRSLQPLTCPWRPGVSRGNLTSKLSATDPVQTGGATATLFTVPSLVAGKAVFPTPGMQTGFLVLTWDAGPDHPSADVWVTYDNNRQRVLLMKQPKGGLQVQVQFGRMYSFVLMDGRIVLATTPNFVAQ